jgi:CHAT domain-containing protein
VLHLACHGRLVDGQATRSHLMLAGDQELSVAAILAQAQSRPQGGMGGLIMPIACVSDLADEAYDEVLSITTSFLAAGAHGTIGTLWNVMDLPSSVLTYVFHQRLVTTGCSPADALRHAQRWMLDPDRTAPRRMPVGLAMAVRDPGLAEVSAWAGFTYQGR